MRDRATIIGVIQIVIGLAGLVLTYEGVRRTTAGNAAPSATTTTLGSAGDLPAEPSATDPSPTENSTSTSTKDVAAATDQPVVEPLPPRDTPQPPPQAGPPAATEPTPVEPAATDPVEADPPETTTTTIPSTTTTATPPPPSTLAADLVINVFKASCLSRTDIRLGGYTGIGWGGDYDTCESRSDGSGLKFELSGLAGRTATIHYGIDQERNTDGADFRGVFETSLTGYDCGGEAEKPIKTSVVTEAVTSVQLPECATYSLAFWSHPGVANPTVAARIEIT